MQPFHHWRTALSIAACLAFTAPAAAADIVVGVPSWPSAQVTANVIASVIKTDLGVETELVDRGTMGILSGMATGETHIHPEVWFPNHKQAVERFNAKSNSIRVSPQGVAATQNLCVTEATAQNTGITNVADLANPKIAAQFDTDGDGKGEMWIGDQGWSSTNIERVRARSYGYDKTMTLLVEKEEVAMAAVDVAVSLEQPIVFYCYSPHHVFDLHKIRKLAEPAHDPATWTIVAPAADSDWLAKSKAETAWDLSHFHIAYAALLDAEHPKVAGFLRRITLEPEDAAAMSYAVQVERKTPADAAAEWIAANRNRIEEWVR
ncbi:MAG: amino acid-binding protein [Hyphomicrobiales bacterium]|nr:MAG: amino acid-binding protein [Hyphomicrobiales bacterium]